MMNLSGEEEEEQWLGLMDATFTAELREEVRKIFDGQFLYQR